MEQQAPAPEPTSVPTSEQLRVMADDKKRFVEEEYDVSFSFVVESQFISRELAAWLSGLAGKEVNENTDSIREKKPLQKEGNTSSVIGRTKTDITQYSTVLPNNPAPVKDVDNSDNFKQFYTV